ncbi:MAG: HAD family phosphatase [Ruminococcaceae bacterium]|nr:HAD family phosphatase [Oscillospiraceae bacterium]
MKISGAIFDTDGTLIESMYVWETVASTYVKSLGKEPAEDLDSYAIRVSVPDTSAKIKKEYAPELSEAEIAEGLQALVYERYKNEVPIKDSFVREFLSGLYEKGIPMYVATGTARHLIVSALERLDLRKYFTDVISTVDTGVNKHHPDVYLLLADKIGASPSDIAVFEDAKYAAKTAKDAGFYVTGVYSDFFREDWEEIKSFTDCNIRSYEEILGKFEK